MSIFDDFPRGHDGASVRHAPLATAKWGKTATPWKEGDLWLGRDDDGQAVGHGDDRHAIVVAGSRAGKGRSVLIPNALLWPGSCVVMDPKGENATITAVRRAQRHGHRVAIIDPRRCADVPDGPGRGDPRNRWDIGKHDEFGQQNPGRHAAEWLVAFEGTL